jgi:hypothetical protein
MQKPPLPPIGTYEKLITYPSLCMLPRFKGNVRTADDSVEADLMPNPASLMTKINKDFADRHGLLQTSYFKNNKPVYLTNIEIPGIGWFDNVEALLFDNEEYAPDVLLGADILSTMTMTVRHNPHTSIYFKYPSV